MTRSIDTEYNYDFPLPSTSSLTAMRSSSPFSHHHPHLPHHNTHSKSTRAADISRLLDPSYSSRHSSSSSPTSVYVDHHGDLHDPDYRHFPPVAHTHTHSHRSSYTVARPRWELGDDSDAIDEDEDAYPTYSPRRSSSLTRKPRDPFRPAYVPYYPSTLEPSPPTSFDSDDTVLSADDESPFADEPKCPIAKKHRSRRRAEEEERRLAEADKENSAQPEYVPSKQPSQLREEQEWTPTCTQSMRRQWQAISLSVRFRVFRAQRRVRRTVSGT